MTRLTRRLGPFNAAQLAPYDRMIVAIDAELGAAAVGRPMGNDGLPGAEVTAFVRNHGRFAYRDASIEHDARRCAVYRGIAKDGKLRRELLGIGALLGHRYTVGASHRVGRLMSTPPTAKSGGMPTGRFRAGQWQ